MMLSEEHSEGDFFLRQACLCCACTTGKIETRNGQDCVFCFGCGRFQYNAPKTETGRKARSIQTTHALIRPATRARVLMRASGRCELCGAKPNGQDGGLHVGHLLSVKDGHAHGLTDSEINGDENLAAFCAECNLGMGEETVPLRLAVAIVLARLGKQEPTP